MALYSTQSTIAARRSVNACYLIGFCAILIAGSVVATPPDVVKSSDTEASFDSSIHRLVKNYCLDCHYRDDQGGDRSAGRLDLESLLTQDIAQHSKHWEQVVQKLRSRQMPPSGNQLPSPKLLDSALSSLIVSLDKAALEKPNPGRTETFRRLNRIEYQNAIRDLLALEVDGSSLLPADESSHGFDNVTVGDLSPTLLIRYIAAARKISRLAVGSFRKNPEGRTVRIRADITQEKHVPGLPLGTRGGTLLHHTFPQDGEYEIHALLTRDRNEHVEGLNGAHEVEFLLDRKKFAKFKVVPPKNQREYYFDDQQLMTRIQVTAGPHDLGVTFVKNTSSLSENKRQPLNAHFNYHRHPRLSPAIFQISITGPIKPDQAGRSRETPSRQRIFTSYPTHPEEEEACAKRIIADLARRAYRRPVHDSDLERPLEFYREAHTEHGFEAGVEMALSAILVSPRFLFRIEGNPKDVKPEEVYLISELELASRLSFFLWSSLPDDELLELAERGELRKPGVLEQQVRRMLADPRSLTLVVNFASQWLHLRNLDSVTPDGRLFPDFDDNLRQALRQETELFFQSIIVEDRSVLDLLKANYTYLNERLAKHYRISHVYGSRFRRVELLNQSHRGGLLRHGSILTVTSYATRTSPVIRGNWILENILGSAVPAPPADVPALDENVIAADLSMRERLAKHRADPACASCHDLMDPVGFALENYDAIGRWRDYEAGKPVDVSGKLPDGIEFSGVRELEDAILKHPDLFVGALTEKILTYALGRGVEHFDRPAVREVVRNSKTEQYRFSEIILNVVNSVPFQMRTSK